MKRKFLVLFLTAALSFSVTACGNDSSAASKTGSTQTEAETESGSSEEIEEPDSQEEEAPEETETEEQDSAETETPADVDNPMAAALENMNSVTSMEAKMVIEMDLTMEAEGQSQAVESVTTMDMAYFTDPMKIKMEMTMDMGAQGSASMSVYADADEDGNYMMYMFDGASWSAAPVDMGDLAEYDAHNSMVSSIGDGDRYALEGTETVDGVNAYKYSYTMTGDEMKESLSSSGAFESFRSLGMSERDVYNMLDGTGEVVTYVWIDEATLYPIKYEMDMTEVMDALMSAVVESLGENAEGISMHIPNMNMTMTCSNFNSAADFTVPEEALSAASAE